MSARLLLLIAVILLAAAPTGSGAATYSWTGSAGTAWTNAANWFPNRTTPAADDRLVFELGGTINVLGVPTQTIGSILVQTNTWVNLQGSSGAGNVLTLSGSPAIVADLDVRAGSTLALQGGNRITLQLATGTTGAIAGEVWVGSSTHRVQAVDAGALVFLAGSHARTVPGFFGPMFGVGNSNSGAGSVHFSSGATYWHTTTADSPFGTAAGAVTVFEPGSTFRLLDNNLLIANGRTFANVVTGGVCELRGTTGCTMDSLTVLTGTFYMTHTAETVIRGHLRVASGARVDVGPASGTGGLRFAGTVEQTIDAVQYMPESATPGLNIRTNAPVVIDNPAGVRFPGTMFPRLDLPGGLHMAQGVFHLDNYTALLLNDGPLTGGSATSWIHGRVQKSLPPSQSELYIPVGTPTESTPIYISLRTAQSNTVTVSALVQSPGDPPASPLPEWEFVDAQIDTTKNVNLIYGFSLIGQAPFTLMDVGLEWRDANRDAATTGYGFRHPFRAIGLAGDTNMAWRRHNGQTFAVPTAVLFQGLQGDHFSDNSYLFAVGEKLEVNLRVDDSEVEEGGGALRTPTLAGASGVLPFRVVLSSPAIDTVRADFATGGGTAQPGGDYTGQSGTLTFVPGDTVEVVEIAIADEGDAEDHESIGFALTGATGATIADGEATGTILDDDDVTSPTAIVTWPNGGETVIEESNVNLTWAATDDVVVASVDLLLSTDGGGTWAPIAEDLPNTGTYAWQAPYGLTEQALLKVVAADHRAHTAEDVSDAVWRIWGVDGVDPVVPRAFRFALASPNPAPGAVRFRLDLTREQRVRLLVHDVSGRRVGVPLDAIRPAGSHVLEWAGDGNGAGIYFVTVTAEEGSAVRRVVRLR
jgi:hypothetical protein